MQRVSRSRRKDRAADTCYTPRPRFRLHAVYNPDFDLRACITKTGLGGGPTRVLAKRRHRYFFLDLRTNADELSHSVASARARAGQFTKLGVRSLCFTRRHVSCSPARPRVIAPGFPVRQGWASRYTQLSSIVSRARKKKHTLARAYVCHRQKRVQFRRNP